MSRRVITIFSKIQKNLKHPDISPLPAAAPLRLAFNQSRPMLFGEKDDLFWKA